MTKPMRSHPGNIQLKAMGDLIRLMPVADRRQILEDLMESELGLSRHAIDTIVAVAELKPVKGGLKPVNAGPKSVPARPTKRPHRTPSQIVKLTENLYNAICATPGARMIVLSRELGTSCELLSNPAKRLKEDGRIRIEGVRGGTRYYCVSPPAVELAKD